MNSYIRHLFWGVTLYTLFVLLSSLGPILMRYSLSLPLSQTYAFIFVGESLSFLPFIIVTKHEWSLNERREWVAFSLFGCAVVANFAGCIYRARNMPLGKRLYYLTLLNTNKGGYRRPKKSRK